MQARIGELVQQKMDLQEKLDMARDELIRLRAELARAAAPPNRSQQASGDEAHDGMSGDEGQGQRTSGDEDQPGRRSSGDSELVHA